MSGTHFLELLHQAHAGADPVEEYANSEPVWIRPVTTRLLVAVLARTTQRSRDRRAQQQRDARTARGTYCLTQGCMTRTTEGYCGKCQAIKASS
jgi:hypothetical protein